MTRRLLLFLGATPDAPVVWAATEGERVVKVGEAACVADLRPVALRVGETTAVVAFLRGEAAVWRVLDAPPKAASKLRAAARLLLEDELAEPAGVMHVAVTADTRAADRARAVVLAVRDDAMRRWRDALAEAAITPAIITADAAVFAGEDRVTVVRRNGRTVFGAPDAAGACENELFDAIAAGLLTEVGDQPATFFGDGDEPPAVLAGAALDERDARDADALVGAYAAALERRSPPNLLQGAYQPRSALLKRLPEWRRPAAIAAGVAALVLAGAAVDAWRLGRTADRWRALATQLHDKRFPDAVGVDPATHARAILRASDAGATFIGLTAKVAGAIADDDAVRVDRVGFDRPRGRVSVTVRSGGHEPIEAFRAALADDGLAMRDNGGFRRSGDELIGDLLADGL
ncbi:MAG: type II secretion system protein GspL [Pseudomonadota bacterium]